MHLPFGPAVPPLGVHSEIHKPVVTPCSIVSIAHTSGRRRGSGYVLKHPHLEFSAALWTQVCIVVSRKY